MSIEGNTSNMINYITLIIGWGLGLLSTIGIDYYKKIINRREIKKGMLTELRELKLRSIATCFNATINYSEITKEWAKWYRPYHKLVVQSNEFDYIRAIPKEVIDIDKLSEEEFYNFLILGKESHSNAQTPLYPQIFLPYLDSKYNDISFFKHKIIMQLSKLKKEITIINWGLSQLWFYHKKSFDNISATNQIIITNNIKNISQRLPIQYKNLITLIETIT